MRTKSVFLALLLSVVVLPVSHVCALTVNHTFSTFFDDENSSLSNMMGVAVDPGNNILLYGQTEYVPNRFPGAREHRFGPLGKTNLTVVKMSADGSRVLWITHIGGSENDTAENLLIQTASDGSIVLCGVTDSPDFPTTSNALRNRMNTKDGVLVKLSPDGDQLLTSSYFGGQIYTHLDALALDSENNIYISGRVRYDTWNSQITRSLPMEINIPSVGPSHPFVTKLNAAGTQGFYTRYFSGQDEAGSNYHQSIRGLTPDSHGNIHMAMETQQPDLYITPDYRSHRASGSWDVYLAKLSPEGSILFSRYLGGSGQDYPLSLAIDSGGRMILTGYSGSNDFGCPNSNQPKNPKAGGFLAFLDSSGVCMHSVFFEGTVRKAKVDSSDRIHVIGLASGPLPEITPNALKTTFDPNLDGFYQIYNPFFGLWYSTYLGGSNFDRSQSIAIDSFGNGIITTLTQSPDAVTTPGAFQRNMVSNRAVYITKFNTEPGPGILTFTTYDHPVYEDEGSVDFLVHRQLGGRGRVSVDYTIHGFGTGLAKEGIDFVGGGGTLDWEDGDTSPKTITVKILDDDTLEPEEYFMVRLFNPQGGATLGADLARGVIIDDEKGIRFQTPNGFTVSESVAHAIVRVSRAGTPRGTIAVDLHTTDDTALAGHNYQSVSAHLVWGDGDTNPKVIRIPIINNDQPDETRHFIVTLSNPSGGAHIVGPASITITIEDDDADTPLPGEIIVEFPESNLVREDAGAITFVVSRVGGSFGVLSLRYETLNGTAQAGFDFEQRSGIIRFADNDTARVELSIPIIDDEEHEPTEYFTLQLTWLDGAQAGKTESYRIEIEDNDPEPQQAPPPPEMRSKNLFNISKNESAEIQTHLSAPGQLTVAIYDRVGRSVHTLVDEHRPANAYRETWNGRDSRGDFVAAGVYTVIIKEGGKIRKIPLVVLK